MTGGAMLIEPTNRKFIEESLGCEAAEGGIASGEKFSRNILEEGAKQTTLLDHGTPSERFWQRQQGQAETIQIGKRYIEQVSTSHTDIENVIC
jgi:anoctamin-10